LGGTVNAEPKKPKPPIVLWRSAILSPDVDVPSHARLTGLALAEFMDRERPGLGNARPGPSRLAKMTGLSHRTVQRALADLVRLGWIEQTRKGGTDLGGKQYASTYRGIPHDTLTPGPTDPGSHSPDPTTQSHPPHDTDDATPRQGGVAPRAVTDRKIESTERAATSSSSSSRATLSPKSPKRKRKSPMKGEVGDFDDIPPEGLVEWD
jgi:DNA-binding transcriptional MocR family regulator